MHKVTSVFLVIFITTFLILSCSSSSDEEIKGFDLANLDTTYTPQEDFYHYAIGGWLKANPVPDDQSIWSGFNELRETTRKQVQSIIDDVSSNPGEDVNSIRYKVGTFYNVGMDTVKIESESWSPLQKEFERIDAITDKDDLIKEIAHMHVYTCSPLFYFTSSADAKNSEYEIAGIWQGGLGLPDRDYYVEEDDRSKEIREKYVEHLGKMFQLIGSDLELSTIEAERVMNFETRLAKASNTRTENRDVNATYNKLTTDEIKSKFSGFDWDLYLTETGVGDPKHIDISQPKFIEEVSKMVEEEPLDTWKSYLRWSLINAMAPYLSSDFVAQDFEFYGKFLEGRKQNEPRWKRVQGTTNRALGEAVGQLYVEKFFPPEAKERAMNIVENILASMGESIKNSEWMSEETKVEALKKLNGFGVKIGYPDKWQDYTDLVVKDDSYVQNIIRANYFDHQEMLKDINQPIKPWEWGMTPQTVNAYYSPVRNEIAFPAGILQFPFFDYRVDDAINYGAMGAVIGHEITHGFDDQGRQYDAEGNIRDWWTKEDAERFNERAQVLVEQFNNYVAINDMTINGEMTLGENIGDLGGLTISYNAFTKTEQYKNGEEIDGFTPAQRFFLSWAQVWKNNITDQELMRRLKVDVHSPGQWRVLGPLSNMPEFFEAFDVKPGDPMRNEKLVKIW
jgi:putative endopeptidase